MALNIRAQFLLPNWTLKEAVRTLLNPAQMGEAWTKSNKGFGFRQSPYAQYQRMAPSIDLRKKIGAGSNFKLIDENDDTFLELSVWPQKNSIEARAMLPPYGAKQTLLFGPSPFVEVNPPQVEGSDAAIALLVSENSFVEGWWLRNLYVAAGKNVVILKLRSRRSLPEDWAWNELARIAALQLAQLVEVERLPPPRRRPGYTLISIIVLGILALFFFLPASETRTPPGVFLNLDSAGGKQIFAFKVNDATECTWRSIPAVPGFNTSVRCSSGEVTRTAFFRPNTSGSTVRYKITFTAQLRPSSSGGTQMGTFWELTQQSLS